MCISISITLVIKFVFIKYGVSDPLFDYTALWASFITINALLLRFLKTLIYTPLDTVESLSNPITITGDGTALKSPKPTLTNRPRPASVFFIWET